MQITPNDVGASKGQLNTLDPKVLQLINAFANRPLLIEKLVLSQTQGVLLKVASDTKQLDIQLPIKTAPLFENISQNGVKLSLSVNNQQQVRVQLQLPPMISGKINNSLTQPIIFQTSKLLSEQALLLDNPKPYLSVPQKLVSSKQSSQQSPLSNADTLNNKIADSKTIKLQMPTTRPSSEISRNASTGQIRGANLTVADAAKLILKSHFSKQLPIANHLSNISKITNTLFEQAPSSPLETKLQKQIEQLMQLIQKPSKYNAGDIKQRLENSGNFLEKNLSKQIRQIETSTNQVVKPDNQNKIAAEYPKAAFFIKQKDSENSKLDKLTSLPKQTEKTLPPIGQANDIKLQLMKIRSTLEAIVNPARQAQSNQPQPPVITPSNTPPDIKPMANQQQATNTSGRTANQSSSQLFNQQQIFVKQSTELLVEVRNIVSQIESNQLLSLKNDVPNLHQFLVDLPFKNNSDIDSFEMLFETSDTDKEGQKIKRWKVVVRFDLEPLGPMFAQIELENERISTQFFAQSEQTSQLINQYLPLLKKSLFTAGVNIDKLEGSQGKIPERLLSDNQQLIDAHA